MAVQPIGGISSSAYASPVGTAAPAGEARRGEPQSKESTIVISKVTKTRDDGSTVTTITYADGHTKVETTPPKFTPTETETSEGKALQGEGRVTAVDILA